VLVLLVLALVVLVELVLVVLALVVLVLMTKIKAIELKYQHVKLTKATMPVSVVVKTLGEITDVSGLSQDQLDKFKRHKKQIIQSFWNYVKEMISKSCIPTRLRICTLSHVEGVTSLISLIPR
jgi:hypothetical protein